MVGLTAKSISDGYETQWVRNAHVRSERLSVGDVRLIFLLNRS